jgi:hypothetical protein
LHEKQALLVEVYIKKDILKVRHIQISILKDFRTTAIAVRRVTTSSGSRTPGVDGVIATTAEKRESLAKQLHSIVRTPSIYKPSAVKRVYISKEDGSQRPLGIPTIVDRAVQAVYLEAIDPLVECNACNNSFGFRKFRSAQDAVLALRGKLIHPKASEWILNADIKKCFDRINHNFLLRSVPVYRKVNRNVLLEKRVFYTSFPSGAVEKICKRQKFVCPACGQSLSNSEDIEVHHSPSLKDLRLLATPNTQVKTVALHKLCHSRMHKDLQNSSKI